MRQNGSIGNTTPAAAQSIFETIIARLEAGQPFAYTKLNHGFWERLIRIERLAGTIDVSDPEQARTLDRRTGPPFFLESGFLKEFLDLYQNVAPQLPDFLFSPGYSPWPDSDRIEGTPYLGKANCQRMIDRLTPSALPRGGNGIEFKQAAIDGSFERLVGALRRQPILVVGPVHVAGFAKFCCHLNATFFEIHDREARGSRHDTFARVAEQIERLPAPPVVLIQAGSLSSWLTIKLRERFSRLTILDFGNALNIANIPRLATQNWSRVYSVEIARTIKAINNSWPDSEDAFPGIADPVLRRQIWTAFSTGREGRLVDLAEAAGCERPNIPNLRIVPVETPLHFIENKFPDHDRIRQLSLLSERANHYANGGPVSRLLEKSIATLHTGTDRSYVALSNCTVGLHVLAGIEAVRRGKDIRWLTSAFTFFSATTGPFKDAAIADCNESGVLDRPTLQQIDPATYDGVIYTNIFGANPAIDQLASFCQENGKALIADNATGLFDPVTAGGKPLPQAISFHHTKPWGFGEGGVIIVDPADEALARQLINFGNGAPDWVHHYASNGKISDPSCAAILDRLERLPLWRQRYHLQVRRIMALIDQKSLPLKPLWRSPPTSPVSSIPLLARDPVPPARLVNDHLVLRKYYRPLNWSGEDLRTWSGSEAFPVADRIFRHIVNFPTHPQMAALSDEVILDVLQQLVTPAA